MAKEIELDEEQSFEDIGLDPRLIRALTKKGLQTPTPIQRVAIPLILEGKDVLARAKTGSGKTFAYLLPLLHKLFSGSISSNFMGPTAFVVVPTTELCQQVYSELMSLVELCRVQLKVAKLTRNMPNTQLKQALSGPPDVLVATPSCVHKCLSAGFLQPKAIQDSLSMLIFDEADLLLSQGYEDDVRAIIAHVPRRCQCLLMSATSRYDDVEKLKKLILHNPYILTLPEEDGGKDEIIPNSVDQFWISCSAPDKFVYILALLKLDLVPKKVLLFTNTIDMGFRLKLFLEKFRIRAAVLNAELPQNSRLHIIEEFNAGLFDYLIAIDDGETYTKGQEAAGKDVPAAEVKNSKKQRKQKLDAEFGVVRGIDFKNVYTVINFEMPATAEGYIHRIGRTGRACNTGASVSLVSPEEMEAFKALKSTLAEHRSGEGDFIDPFPLPMHNVVEALRYRAESQGRSVTRTAIVEARKQDIRNEILNSEELTANLQANNPRDLDILKHDKDLSKKESASYLGAEPPEYILDATTQELIRNMKLDRRAALGNEKPSQYPSRKRRFRKNKDPLKAISTKGFKQRNRMRRKGSKKE
ncbi:DEAD-box ATP-dependent RNA helicase 16 isoform X3 [Silene latifolia]|uniref:DEAD-box ATP-dependent RNA helicase 16 isoform X3 n=1 Tax=Silene latifolia TaxID=37657 RepID=UPI003D76DF7F